MNLGMSLCVLLNVDGLWTMSLNKDFLLVGERKPWFFWKQTFVRWTKLFCLVYKNTYAYTFLLMFMLLCIPCFQKLSHFYRSYSANIMYIVTWKSMVLTCTLQTINLVPFCWWEPILPKVCHKPKEDMRVTSLFQMNFNPSLDFESFLSGTAFVTHARKNNLENIKYLKSQCLSLERNQIYKKIYI